MRRMTTRRVTLQQEFPPHSSGETETKGNEGAEAAQSRTPGTASRIQVRGWGASEQPFKGISLDPIGGV